MFDAILLGWALAALLFFLALAGPAAGPGRRRRQAALAGAIILAGAAIYGADIMNLPEIAGALVIGAAIGLLLARELPMRRLPLMMRVLAGGAGAALTCAALAIRFNPYAFGLLGEDQPEIAPWGVAALVIALLTGVLAAGAGMARPGWRIGGAAGLIAPGLLALLAGASFAMSGAGERLPWLATGIALAAPAGALLGARAATGGEAAILAAVVGLVGWSAAAVALLLENTGLIVAAGLAGSAGTLLAVRLNVRHAGRGLPTGYAMPNA